MAGRFFRLFSGFFLLFVLCAESPGGGEPTVHLRFWYSWTGPHRLALEGLCKEYEHRNPHIRIETLQVSNMNQKLLPAVAGGIPPDVVVFNRPMISNWAAENTFTALDSLIHRDGIQAEDFLKACWDECEYGGQIWGIPVNTDNRVFFWNKKIFREEGLDPERPPRTWKELEEFAERLTRRDASGRLERVGFFPLWGNSYFFIYAYQKGVRFISEDGRKTAFNSPEALETLEWIVKFARTYNIQALTNFRTGFGPQTQNPFITGKVAMMVDGSWEPDYWRQYAPDLEYGVTYAPVPEGGEISTWSGGMALVIPRHSSRVEEAWDFIKFFTAEESQEVLARSWNIPSRKAVIQRLHETMPEPWRICADLMDKSHFLPKTPIQDFLFEAIDRMTEVAIFGSKSPQKALQDTAQDVQSALDKFYTQKSYPLLSWPRVIFWSCLIGILILGVVFYLSKTRGCLAAYTRHDILEGYLFAAPWLIGFIFFTAGPVLVSFLFSFCDYRVLSPARWVGMNNYREMVFEDPLFWKSLWNTAYYTAFHVPLGLCGALLLAVLLNQKVRGMRFFRTIFYIPSIISGVAVSVLWMWILNPEYGILNAALSKIGIQGPGWLTDPAWSKPAIIVMSLWGLGAGMMVLLAALQGIPRHLYESARIDGAGVFLQFIYITVPLLTPALFFNLVIGIIGSFQIFTQAYVMTNGGPLDSTLFYALYLFRTAFQSFRMGYASAMAWILFAVVLSLTLVQMRLAKRWVYYETGGPGK